MTEPILKVEGISKSFPGVKALDNVHLEVHPGEVLVLVGENGAGKSSLMKILSGIYTKDAGRIFFEGKEVEIASPLHAQHLGVTIIHQEMNLMSDLTVAQNIYIGREPMIGPFLSEAKLNKTASDLLERLNINLNAKQHVGELTVAKQQMVEIAKALSFNAKVLIMDEPTSALTDTEVEVLFTLIEQLKASGTAIIYISHRMDELKRLADRVTVLRDGSYIGSLNKDEIDIPKVIEMMVGRHIDEGTRPAIRDKTSNETVLRVRGLSTKSLLRDVSFDLHRGEILGFAGLMGAGRTETARAIIKADPTTGGTVEYEGKVARIKQPADAVRLGIGYLSEDRKLLGLMLEQDVTFNTILASLPTFTDSIGIVRDGKAKTIARDKVSELRIKTPSIGQMVKLLSGGNQQKVVIAKWLVRDCDVLIFDEPTRGIDVGAKEEIYALLQLLAAEGKSIIVISSELPEILRVANRVIVMAGGRITGELHNEEASQEKIMHLATHGGGDE
ncbi:sugar ABC transporter ATP-binding protein [Salinibacterium sp. G-O1]|uniref:sugar ABC transporter ATP-binding protein n=1 Tax=Salinibacterium sp. G-O1 TaxID=3046208 RepID=UPI0024BB0341|nr:sugar ABC transporter ATP-binding protein [Salinibacterium sp. G-O1]MDJ0335733.1 sugar ABC transporter ATP-binding protein [Salinibacterium sp. G-O1]